MNSSNELGTQPVARLLLKYATPAIIAMMASSLYNIIDSIFIGHGCGAMALAGLTIAKPFMDICAAFGSLVGVGAGTLVAIKLGEKDYATAQKVLGNVVVLNVIISALVMIPGLLFLRPILFSFGASEATILYAYEYMEIILWGNILTHLYFGLNNVLRSAGHPMFSMSMTIVAVTSNVILDYIFIFPLQMGVRGAALATVIAQGISVVLQFIVFLNPKELLHFHRGIWRLEKRITLRALSIGLSPFLMNLAHSLVVIIINNQLKHYGGDMSLATYGIINRFTFIFAMIVMGLNQGMQPLVGFNYGAKQYNRVLRGFKLTAIAATAVMTVVFVLGETIPEWLSRIFTDDAELIADSVVPMRILNCAMWLVGFQMVTGNFFTSIGMAGKSIFLSLTRQVLYLVPLALILPLCFTESPILGVWWALPVSDILSAITAMIMLSIEIKKFHKLMADQQAWVTTVPPQPD